MAQPSTLKIERVAGQRATFVVYYKRNGKTYLDGLFSRTEEMARRDFLAGAQELGWTVEIDRIEKREES